MGNRLLFGCLLLRWGLGKPAKFFQDVVIPEDNGQGENQEDDDAFFHIVRLSNQEPQSTSFDWIIPPGMKRVTLQQATHRETEASQNTIPVDGDAGILRAGRLKSACRAEQRGDPVSVAD
jgi:hypothetical protein